MNTYGTLFVVATPIGNLSDFSPRAIEILSSVEVIFCEDTRNTRNLMSSFNIGTELRSFHQHSGTESYNDVLNLLKNGTDVALVSDAGTPVISDPGGLLVQFLHQQEVEDDNFELNTVAIPGPSAVVAALSVAGFAADKFTFLGFPPHKKKRNQFFEEVADSKYTVAFYESPYRIQKALDSLADLLPEDREVCVSREISKKFETHYRGSAQQLAKMGIKDKGEFVVVVDKK